MVLYKWDRRALAIPDSLGRLPLSIARSRGHTKLAECLEQLQREEQQAPATLPPSTRMSFSPGPDAPTTDSWMVNWANDSVMAPSSKKGGSASTTTTSSTTSLNPGRILWNFFFYTFCTISNNNIVRSTESEVKSKCSTLSSLLNLPVFILSNFLQFWERNKMN